ncbi:hypothetical protein ACC848_41480, partial [Rhizobium johnstonii]
AITVASTGIHLTLAEARLGDTQHALLTARTRIEVPASDTAEFLRDAYPRLARDAHVVPGPGVRLPAPEETTAVAVVGFGPSATVKY